MVYKGYESYIVSFFGFIYLFISSGVDIDGFVRIWFFIQDIFQGGIYYWKEMGYVIFIIYVVSFLDRFQGLQNIVDIIIIDVFNIGIIVYIF